jgi:hypothetical protein
MFAGGTYGEGCGKDSACARPTLQEAAAGVTTSRVGAGSHQCPERVHNQDILNETLFTRIEHCDFTSNIASIPITQGPAPTSCPLASFQIVSSLPIL